MGDSDTEPRVILNTDTETMDFVECFEKNEDVDEIELAMRRLIDSLAAAEGHLEAEAEVTPKPIIPTPLMVDQASMSAAPKKAPRQLYINSSWTVVYDGQQLRNEARLIASEKNTTTTIYTTTTANKIDNNYRKGGNYSNVLPLKTARRHSISNLTYVGTSNLSCRQTQCCFIQSHCGAPR